MTFNDWWTFSERSIWKLKTSSIEKLITFSSLPSTETPAKLDVALFSLAKEANDLFCMICEAFGTMFELLKDLREYEDLLELL